MNTATDFGTPRIDSIFSVDAGFVESSPYLHPGGRSLYFVSLGRPGPGGQDISLDEKTLFLARDQARGRDVWVAHRSSPGASFGPPQRVAGLDALDVDEIPAWLSDDLCRLYFTSNRNPADASPNLDYRLWVAERARK